MECVEIMTGAPVPSGADAVVMVEYTAERDGWVEISRAVTPGLNVVPQASESRRGDPVEQRAVARVVFARQPRQQPIAVARELMRDADADGVVAFPGIVADQAGQQPDRDQDQQGNARQRQGDACARHYSATLTACLGLDSPASNTALMREFMRLFYAVQTPAGRSRMLHSSPDCLPHCG